MEKTTKILVISDTHSNHKLLEKVLFKNHDCEYLIHLGDEPDDLEGHPHLTENKQMLFVYGLYHQKWSSENAVSCFSICGQEFCITHARQYFSTYKENCIYCFGHTHHKYYHCDGTTIVINPGHLKKETDRGETAGYVIVELGKEKTIRFFDYDHECIEAYTIL